MDAKGMIELCESVHLDIIEAQRIIDKNDKLKEQILGLIQYDNYNTDHIQMNQVLRTHPDTKRFNFTRQDLKILKKRLLRTITPRGVI